MPSGIDARSTSTLAMARTSADADMFFRNSAHHDRQRPYSTTTKSPTGQLDPLHPLVWHPISSHLFSPSPPRPEKPLTLDRGLGTGAGDGAHGTDHEVLVHQVLVGAVLGNVVAEVGDIGGRLGALEGALVGAGRALGPDGGRGQAPDSSPRYGGARERAGGGCEGRHCELQSVERGGLLVGGGWMALTTTVRSFLGKLSGLPS